MLFILLFVGQPGRSVLHRVRHRRIAGARPCAWRAASSPRSRYRSDLMKIVFKIKEDDARNPGVIADCTGDNAGDSVDPRPTVSKPTA